MRVTFVELPDRLRPDAAIWSDIVAAKPHLLVLNELPFGPWIAESPDYDAQVAEESVAAHTAGIEMLRRLPVPIIAGSRAVPAGDRLANEGFVIDGGAYRAVHHKQYYPQEPGFWEATWFGAARRGFEPVEVDGLSIGLMLCTDLMFNEWARHYRHRKTHVILVPRATESAHHRWEAAGAMAAIVSGCYVISSNRVGPGEGEVRFGGNGFAFAPDGTRIARTSAERPIVTIEIDPEIAVRQRSGYPCYVGEL